MSRQYSARIIICLSVLYGATIAIMAILGAPGLGLAAIIGAIILGMLWTFRGILSGRDS